MKPQQFMMIIGGGACMLMLGFGQPTDGPDRQHPQSAHESEPKHLEKGEDRSAHGPDADHRSTDQPNKMRAIQINPDALRARLERSISRTEQMLERNKSALAKLEGGATPAEVLTELRHEGVARRTADDDRNAPNNRQRPGANKAGTPDRLSPQTRAKMHQFIRENFPDLWKNLEEVSVRDARSGDRLLARMSPRIQEILLLEESQPELAKMKIEEMQAGLAFVQASRLLRRTMNDPEVTDTDRANAMNQLRMLAARRFDVQLKAKQYEIDQLEARLNELRSTVDQILQRRDDEIEHMVNTARSESHSPAKENRAHSRND